MIKRIFIMSVSVYLMIMLIGCDMASSNTFTFILDESYDSYITMGTSADYPPYEWLTNDGSNNHTVVGIDIEIAKVIANALEKNLKVVNRGFDFLLEDLKSGKVDFVISAMTPTEARAKVVDFSNIYYKATQVVLIKSNDFETFDSIESLNKSNVRIGAQLGSIQQTYAEDIFGLAQKQFIQAVPDLVLGLRNNQLSGVIMERPVAEGFINNLSGLAIADFSIGDPEDGSAVAVRKNNTELLTVINEVIDNLIASGQMDQFVSDFILLNNG